MNSKPIIIVCGEPNSIFSEILVKAVKKYNNTKPLIIIGSYNLINSQLESLNLKLKLNLVTLEKNFSKNLKINKINIININYSFKRPFEPISSKSNKYISKCFDTAIKIIKKYKTAGLINGPISKKFFLKNNFLGITEYLSEKFDKKQNYSMLIYNKILSVSPITTHLPLNKVSKELKKDLIVLKSILIKKFYEKNFSKNPKIAITGLNPHCENFFNKTSEEDSLIKPAIKILKSKKVKVAGPFPADTIFLKQNLKKFDVIVGMYHDQVLTPIKSMYGFKAINITLGLPFLRISPDHGPNNQMVGKNKSDPQSLIESIKFLDKLK